MKRVRTPSTVHRRQFPATHRLTAGAMRTLLLRAEGRWPANTDGDPGYAEAARKFALILRHAAQKRACSLDYLRRSIRAWADALDPRPGVLTFPAEDTSAPTREGAA